MNRREFLTIATALTAAFVGRRVTQIEAEKKQPDTPKPRVGWCVEYIPAPTKETHTAYIPIVNHDH